MVRAFAVSVVAVIIGIGVVQGVQARGSLRAVGFGTFSSCSFALLSNGDVLVSVFGNAPDKPPGPWSYFNNVYASAGTSSAAAMVGMTMNNCNGPAYAVAANGDFYTVSWHCGGLEAALVGNVFAEAGQPTNIISQVGRSDCGQFAYASADNGDVFRKNGSGWEFIANIAGDPTPANRSSLGTLKVRFQ